MNQLIKFSALAVLMMAVGYNTAMADPVNINITGKVVASPCTVNNGNSDLNVDLGTTIQASSFVNAGDATPPKGFNLSLTGCPVGTNNVTVTFTGTAASAPQTTMYKNTGTATSLAVELSITDLGTILSNNVSITRPVQAGRTVTFPLSARAVTSTGSVAPGTIVALVQANFTYN